MLKTTAKPSINYLVYALGSSLAKGSSRYYGIRYNVRVPETRILSTLGSRGPLPSRDLVKLTAMDKGMVSRVLATLKDRGYVQQADPGRSARLRKWSLTEEGEAFVELMRPEWKRREAVIQSCLTDREREQLRDMLQRLFVSSEKLRAEEGDELAKEGFADSEEAAEAVG